MRNARVTVLMRPDEKASLDAKAAERGVSSGEYLRLAVDNFDKVSDDQEAELLAHLDRGYEQLEVKLQTLGANVERHSGDE